MTNQVKYRPDIDGLRAIAVIFVVCFHAFPNIFKGGFVGVDIFFVISGYLITKIIFESLNAGVFSFQDFYLRRIKRIFPALSLVLFAVCLFGSLSLYVDEYNHLKKHMAGGGFFLSNFLLWSESGYFDVSAETKPLLHLWSLGVEEQFYLVWPLLIFFAWRKKIRLGFLIPLLAAASFFYGVLVIFDDAVGAFYSPVSRFWELLSGGCLAVFAAQNKKDSVYDSEVSSSNFLSVIGAALLVLSFLIIDRSDLFPGLWAVFPVLSAICLIAAGDRAYINRKILSNPVLVWFGLISFPLYLWHWPLISFSHIIFGDLHKEIIRIAVIFISILLAWGTYNFIEQPIRSAKCSYLRLPLLCLLLLSIGLFGAAAYVQEPKSIDSPPQKESTNVWPLKKKVMLLGDSHAHHLEHGLKKQLGPNLSNMSFPSCIPFWGLDVYSKIYKQKYCLNAIKNAYDYLEKDKDIGMVVLASMGPVYMSGETFHGMGLRRVDGLQMALNNNLSVTDRWEMYETALRDSLLRLQVNNKKVIFVIDVPEIGLDPKSCFLNEKAIGVDSSPPIRRQNLSNCTVSRADYNNRVGRYKEIISRVINDFPKVTLFDPTSFFCNEEFCDVIKDNKVLYSDSDHLSSEGSEYIAKYLVPLILSESR